MITFGSLFAGIGGLDLGLERAGMTCKWQVEIDPWCRRVLAKHWPDVERFEDVREVGKHNLEAADVIVGGDPCQDNSNASRHDIIRAELAPEFLRIIEEARPYAVLRENPFKVRNDAPWPWWRFRAELERIGYCVLPFRLRACCLGFSHRRDRLFLFATLPDTGSERPQREEFSQMADSRRQVFNPARQDWRVPAPRVCRGCDGIPHRVDRLRGLGNAVVPQVAEWIGRRIVEANR